MRFNLSSATGTKPEKSRLFTEVFFALLRRSLGITPSDAQSQEVIYCHINLYLKGDAKVQLGW